MVRGSRRRFGRRARDCASRTSRNAGDDAEHEVFDARLRRGGDRDGVAVATQAGGDPENVDFVDRGLGMFASVSLPASERPGRVQTPAQSTDPRQLIPGEQRHDPLAADRSSQGHHARMVGHDLADDRGLAPERVAAHRLRAADPHRAAARPRSASPRWRRTADRGRASRRRPALPGEGDRRLRQLHSDLRRRRQFVQRAGDSAAGRVAHAADRRARRRASFASGRAAARCRSPAPSRTRALRAPT